MVEVEGTFLGKPFRESAPRAIITLRWASSSFRRAPGAVRFTPI